MFSKMIVTELMPPIEFARRGMRALDVFLLFCVVLTGKAAMGLKKLWIV